MIDFVGTFLIQSGMWVVLIVLWVLSTLYDDLIVCVYRCNDYRALSLLFVSLFVVIGLFVCWSL